MSGLDYGLTSLGPASYNKDAGYVGRSQWKSTIRDHKFNPTVCDRLASALPLPSTPKPQQVQRSGFSHVSNSDMNGATVLHPQCKPLSPHLTSLLTRLCHSILAPLHLLKSILHVVPKDDILKSIRMCCFLLQITCLSHLEGNLLRCHSMKP